jgi:hypothetical protein
MACRASPRKIVIFISTLAFMRNIEMDRADFEWAYYAKLSPKFKRNLRQLFINLTFSGRVEDAPLNIIMDGPPALTLGLEPIYDDLMSRPPTKRSENIAVDVKEVVAFVSIAKPLFSTPESPALCWLWCG